MKKIICIALSIILLSGISLMSFNAISFTNTNEGDNVSDKKITRYSYDPDGIWERSDFDTDEEYNEYISDVNEEMIDTINKSTTYSITRTISPNNSVNATAQKKYTIKNLSIDNTIQNFHVGTGYIFTTQKRKNSETNELDIHISRCKIQSDGKTAVFMDKMILRGFGHDQILTPYSYNNKTYFWIGCKANTAFPKNLFTTQLGRIQYQAGKTYTNYNQICRFGNLNYANKNCSSIGAVKRIDAALSSDKSTLLLAVRSYTEDEVSGKLIDKTIAYSCYNNTKLNQALDEVESNPSTNLVIFKNNEFLKNACLFTVKQDGEENFILPYRSCQGLELTNAYSIYMTSGKYVSTPKISKLIKSGNTYNYSSCVTLRNSDFSNTTEIEGLQICGNYLYFAITGTNGASKTQCIYSIDKTIL